jgi:hypothetical protein
VENNYKFTRSVAAEISLTTPGSRDDAAQITSVYLSILKTPKGRTKYIGHKEVPIESLFPVIKISGATLEMFAETRV